MNQEKLKKLLELFAESSVEELEIEHSFWRGTRIRISRTRSRPPVEPLPREEEPAGRPSAPPVEETPAEPPAPNGEEPVEETPAEPPGHAVRAPMVGTFYRSSSPETEPFVREGDQVRAGQTVCIIEAMKIMNEIEADIDGEVLEVLIDDAEPVEYNQPLIYIRPA